MTGSDRKVCSFLAYFFGYSCCRMFFSNVGTTFLIKIYLKILRILKNQQLKSEQDVVLEIWEIKVAEFVLKLKYQQSVRDVPILTRFCRNFSCQFTFEVFYLQSLQICFCSCFPHALYYHRRSFPAKISNFPWWIFEINGFSCPWPVLTGRSVAF